MAVVTRACVKRGMVSSQTWETLKQALVKHNLPLDCGMSAQILADGAASDKKRRGGSITLVLPCQVGKCELVSYPVVELEGFFSDGL